MVVVIPEDWFLPRAECFFFFPLKRAVKGHGFLVFLLGGGGCFPIRTLLRSHVALLHRPHVVHPRVIIHCVIHKPPGGLGSFWGGGGEFISSFFVVDPGL